MSRTATKTKSIFDAHINELKQGKGKERKWIN